LQDNKGLVPIAELVKKVNALRKVEASKNTVQVQLYKLKNYGKAEGEDGKWGATA
jgi:hypothetical protein